MYTERPPPRSCPREQVQQLRGLVREQCAAKPKCLHGAALSGSMLGAMLTSYVQAINRGAVPCVARPTNISCSFESGTASSVESAVLYGTPRTMIMITFSFCRSPTTSCASFFML